MKDKKVMLDLFQLHKEEDIYRKAWILASGKNLEKEVSYLLKQLSKKYKRYEVLNKIVDQLGINIKFSERTNPLLFGSLIRDKREKFGFKKYFLQKTSKTSGDNWRGIEESKFIPSCKKLKRIFKILKVEEIEFKCERDDYCLEKFIQIYKGIYFKKYIPLILIKKLLDIWKKEFDINKEQFNEQKRKILNSINKLMIERYCAQNPNIKAILDEDLAKIIGAFCADGYLGGENRICWEEEHLSNLQALQEWIKNYFGKIIKIEKSSRKRNSWTIEFKDVIIARYLNRFFEFKPGCKKYKVREPMRIRKSPFYIQKAFAIGAMIFEAGMNNSGNISFSVVSKMFRDDLVKIFKNEGIELHLSTRKDKNKHRLYAFEFNKLLNKDERIKMLSYFEKNTFKWLKLKEHIFGFKGKVKDLNEAEEALKKYYYKKRDEPKIERLFNLIRDLENFDVYDLIKIINCPRGSLVKPLKMLNRCNIIDKNLEGRRIRYNYNKDIEEWKLPNVSLHPTLDSAKPL